MRKMLIKSEPMEKRSNMNHIDPENIAIIKKIIDDFDYQSSSSRTSKKKRSCKTKKISNSDSFIHKYKKSQISPKTINSLDGNIIRYKPSSSIDDFFHKENSDKIDTDVFINIVENCDNENTDANAFQRLRRRKSIFSKTNVTDNKFSAELDEFQEIVESKTNQERVNKNFKEVCIYPLFSNLLSIVFTNTLSTLKNVFFSNLTD